jgi:REP element-mobilizing transposase RayT
MNRGHDGKDIFCENKYKSQFLDLLADASKKMKIRILAYCIMNNHFHIVLENSSGKMSECMKRLNGLYGMYYRKISGGMGYVFQGRFKSTLIEKDAYLFQSIVYLLVNPVRAGIVQYAGDYIWSSIKSYFSKNEDEIVDAKFVNELFGTKEQLFSAMQAGIDMELPIRTTRYGDVLGNSDFFNESISKFDRRKKPTDQSPGNQRIDERYFDPIEKVFYEFEELKGIKIEKIDVRGLEGKRLRGELLVWLRERAGLTYREINRLDIFCDVSFDTLRDIYRRMK